MRILICDDDSLVTEQVSNYIQDFFATKNLCQPELVTYNSGEALLADKGDKDIVFLDIEMPGINGIYTGKELKNQNQNVIIFIITSYTEYLDEAMRFHVFRYLSKPIEKQRLFRNLKDALQLYNTSVTKIPIETKSGVHSVFVSDIVCVEAHGRKVIIHTTTQDYESIHTMQYWIDKLTMNCFFQTHRSFIINMEHVTDFNHDLIYLYHRQFTAYLTRRKFSQYKAAYLLYLESMQ